MEGWQIRLLHVAAGNHVRTYPDLLLSAAPRNMLVLSILLNGVRRRRILR